MSEATPEPTPAERLRTEIAKNRKSPWVAVGPLATLLPIIDAWVVDVERKVGKLAAMQLRAHYRVETHPAQLEGLALMSDEARMVFVAWGENDGQK